MDKTKKMEIRERETLFLNRILRNAISEKRWLVVIFIKLFFSFLIRHAIDVQLQKIAIAANREKHKKEVTENPFIYRMR